MPKIYFWGEYWALGMSLAKLDTFPIFPKSLVVQQLVTQLVHKVFHNRYQVTFYLWRSIPVLKLGKLSKLEQENCLTIFSFFPSL